MSFEDAIQGFLDRIIHVSVLLHHEVAIPESGFHDRGDAVEAGHGLQLHLHAPPPNGPHQTGCIRIDHGILEARDGE